MASPIPYGTSYITTSGASFTSDASSPSATISDPESSAVASIGSEVDRLGLAIENAERRLVTVLGDGPPSESPDIAAAPTSAIRAVQAALTAQIDRLNLLIARVES